MMMVMTDEDTEVRRAKRSWPAQYKLDILNEIEAAKESGRDDGRGDLPAGRLVLVVDQRVAQTTR